MEAIPSCAYTVIVGNKVEPSRKACIQYLDSLTKDILNVIPELEIRPISIRSKSMFFHLPSFTSNIFLVL